MANLGQHLDEMVSQEIARTPPGWAGPPDDLLRRAARARVPVAVVGTLAELQNHLI